jgi:membrane fusion protein (multidrug efflux system)
VIPEIALVSEGRSRYVFVIEDGVAMQREVQTGARQRGIVEILGGLEPGVEFVTEGTQSLRHGVAIRRVGERS